jgi:hypothetical protein
MFRTTFIVGSMITRAKAALGWTAFLFDVTVSGVVSPTFNTAWRMTGHHHFGNDDGNSSHCDCNYIILDTDSESL